MGMNQGGRIVLLTSAVVLLMIGVVCLKQRLGYQETPPVFVPSDVTVEMEHENRVARQPTILSTESSTTSQPWHETEPIPASDLAPVPASTFPVNSEVPPPTGNFKPFEEPKALPIEAPFGQNSQMPKDAVPLEPEPLPVSEPLPDVAPRHPHVVVTSQNDSFWKISEQAYGQGIYYRALFAVNRDRVPRPDRIPAGVEILTPTVEELRQLVPDLCPSGS